MNYSVRRWRRRLHRRLDDERSHTLRREMVNAVHSFRVEGHEQECVCFTAFDEANVHFFFFYFNVFDVYKMCMLGLLKNKKSAW